MHSAKYADRITRMNARCGALDDDEAIRESSYIKFERGLYSEDDNHEIKVVHNPEAGYAYPVLVEKDKSEVSSEPKQKRMELKK